MKGRRGARFRIRQNGGGLHATGASGFLQGLRSRITTSLYLTRTLDPVLLSVIPVPPSCASVLSLPHVWKAGTSMNHTLLIRRCVNQCLSSVLWTPPSHSLSISVLYAVIDATRQLLFPRGWVGDLGQARRVLAKFDSSCHMLHYSKLLQPDCDNWWAVGQGYIGQDCSGSCRIVLSNFRSCCRRADCSSEVQSPRRLRKKYLRKDVWQSPLC